jgi:hypothetical protein
MAKVRIYSPRAQAMKRASKPGLAFVFFLIGKGCFLKCPKRLVNILL